MNNVSTQTVKTMSSREIAELTGKRHPDVKRDIQVQLGQLGDVSKFAHTYLDASNRKQTEYQLPRRECEILVTGYDVVRRAAVIDRWLELETAPKQVTTGNPLLDALLVTQQQLDTTVAIQKEHQIKLENIQEKTEKVAEAVKLMEIPVGYMSISEIKRSYAKGFSEKVIQESLDYLGWEKSYYNRQTNSGYVQRNCVAYSIEGKRINLKHWFEKVRREAKPVSAYFYTHWSIGGRFMIGKSST